MLVLRRKRDQDIVLNSGLITIRVLAVEGDRVKLGITAPPDIDVLRGELLDGPASQVIEADESGIKEGRARGVVSHSSSRR